MLSVLIYKQKFPSIINRVINVSISSGRESSLPIDRRTFPSVSNGIINVLQSWK